MFKANGYRIIETKEEFLEEWNARWERYNSAVMPYSFNLDKATFPIALRYWESFDPRCCGSWSIEPLEETKAIILQAYQDKVNHFTNKIEQLKNFGG